MGICTSAPRTLDLHDRDEDKIISKNKLRAITAESSNRPAPSRVELSNDDKGSSNASFLIRSEDDHLSKSSFDGIEMAPTSQDSTISSNLSIATSIQERRGEETPLNRVESNEGRPSGDAAESNDCAREGNTSKGYSNASSLATVLEEPVQGKSLGQAAGNITGRQSATDAFTDAISERTVLEACGASSGRKPDGATEVTSMHGICELGVGLCLPNSASSGERSALPAASKHATEAPAELETSKTPRGTLSTAAVAEKAHVKSQPLQQLPDTDKVIVERQPSTPRGRGATSGQVPMGPGWSSARAQSQATSSSTESGGPGGIKSTVHRAASGLEQQTSGMRKPAAPKVHGFVAKAALLRSSPYSTPLPAFSDTRPTYSRDAQDDEASSYEDPSGNSFVLQLRTPSRMAAFKLGEKGTSQLANATGACYTSEVRRATTPPEDQRSAVIEREAEAVLRTWTEDDDAGDCNDAEMGSLTGWQALADQVMAEMEGDEADDQGNAEEQVEGVSPTVLMQAAGLMSTMNPVIGTSGLPSGDASNKPSTELQPGGTFFVQYEVREELGEGAFGKVVKVRRRRDGRMFVAKILHDRGMTDKARVEAQNEVAVLASLDHPNVVKYYECFAERGTQVKIVMELCEDGDLDGFLKAQGGQQLSEDDIMHKFVQICLSIHYIHSKGIIHRDLKTCNLLLDAGIVKLGDFGISRLTSGEQNAAQTMVGTPYYMSPETFKGKGYGPKTDVWALGCILYEMCCLRKAFEAPNLGAITIKIMSGKYSPIPGHYSNDMRLLVDALLKKDPNARPCMDDVMGLIFVRVKLKAYASHCCLTTARRRSSHARSLTPYRLWADETTSNSTSPVPPDQSILESECNAGERAAIEEAAVQLQPSSKDGSSRNGSRSLESTDSGRIFDELKRHLSRPESSMRSQGAHMQADHDKENALSHAKEEADKSARLHAQHLARTSETITALEGIRALKESWDQYAKQAVTQEAAGVTFGQQFGQLPDISAAARNGLLSLAKQQPNANYGGPHAVPGPAPTKGRKRRSSSFDMVAAKQGIGHRKSTSFDTAVLGPQHGKPDTLLGSHSRLGPGLVGGDSGMAGAGAREVQDDENWGLLESGLAMGLGLHAGTSVTLSV